jgi:lipopolysaccharide transport system permease protein
MSKQTTSWEWEITPKTNWLGTSLQELGNYRDLLWQMVRKNFALYYQQTLLGPLWMVINPILTVLVYTFIFNRVIGISTNGVPPIAFYLVGITLWTLFLDIFNGTSNIFTQNAYLFSKVYFPRLIIPLSSVLLHLLRFSIQLMILLIVLLYMHISGELQLSPLQMMYAIPVIVIMTSIALGSGLIVSVVTAKYKDISNLVGLFTRLLFFICPIFYSVSIVPNNMGWIVAMNPMASLFEIFRFAFVGAGHFDGLQVLYSGSVALVLLFTGVMIYNKQGDRLIDVI